MYKTAAKKKFRSEYDLYDDLEQIKEALSNAAVDVKGRAGEILTQQIEDMKDKTSRLQTGMTDFISEKPVKTLGATLLVGMIIGYFLHR